MNRKFGVVAILLVVISSVIGGQIGHRPGTLATIVKGNFGGGTASSSASPRGQTTAAIERVKEDYRHAMETVAAHYAGNKDGELPFERASQTAIQGMLWTLDPHSSYFPPNDFRKLREDQESRFYGIGVSIRRHRDGVYVQAAVENTPAARAGLRYGDRILEVDGNDAREWTSEQVSKNVRGERGARVRLTVERAGASAPQYFTIVRDAVPLPSIRNHFMIRPGTGYVGLSGGFQHTTSAELQQAIANLKAQGMRQLILDLRFNPGGLLDQSIAVASQFLPRNETIVSVRGRDQDRPIVYRSSGEMSPENFPLVVLINRSSASASEIVAGAVQDHGRGLVVGETSFGKGLVQRVFLLPFGNGLTLTTAKYYTPYGRLIQRDYSAGSLYDYYARHDPSSTEEPPAADAAAKEDPSKTPATPASPPPPPTGPAVKTAAGRIFYSGGGITPDVEVKPLDYSAPARGRIAEAAFYFTRQLAAGLLPGLESYRVETPQPDRDPRPTDFPITNRVIEAFRSYVEQDGELNLTARQIDKDIDYVRLRIREEIITAAYSSEAAVRVSLESDPQVLRATEALPDAKRLAEQVLAETSNS